MPGRPLPEPPASPSERAVEIMRTIRALPHPKAGDGDAHEQYIVDLQHILVATHGLIAPAWERAFDAQVGGLTYARMTAATGVARSALQRHIAIAREARASRRRAR